MLDGQVLGSVYVTMADNSSEIKCQGLNWKLASQHLCNVVAPGSDVPLSVPQTSSVLALHKSTSVYVGKIANTVDDTVMQALLEACGGVKSWKRQEDPETKQPKGFGFCEFEDAEGVLRALRLLSNLSIDGQELLVKSNSATQKYVEAYEREKEQKDREDKEEGEHQVIL